MPANREATPSEIRWTHFIYALHGAGVALGIATSAFIVTSFLFGPHRSWPSS